MFMRALLVGEHTPVRATNPVHCFCCGCTQPELPLYRFNQLLRREWVACLPCGLTKTTPDRLEPKCKHVELPRPRTPTIDGEWKFTW